MRSNANKAILSTARGRTHFASANALRMVNSELNPIPAMTISLTKAESRELWLEAKQNSLQILSQEPLEMICEMPPQLGIDKIAMI